MARRESGRVTKMDRRYFDHRIANVTRARDATANNAIRRMLTREIRRLENLRSKVLDIS